MYVARVVSACSACDNNLMFIKYLSEQPMNSGHPSIPPSFLPSSLSFPVSHYQPCVSSIKYIYTVIDPQSIKQFPICQNRGS